MSEIMEIIRELLNRYQLFVSCVKIGKRMSK